MYGGILVTAASEKAVRHAMDEVRRPARKYATSRPPLCHSSPSAPSRVNRYQNSQKGEPNTPPSLSSNSSPALVAFPPSLPLGSNTKENLGKQLHKDENLHFLYTHIIPDFMRPWLIESM